MPMAGIRGPGRRGKDRSRATAAVLISASVVLAVLVVVGVVAFLHSRSSNTAQRRAGPAVQQDHQPADGGTGQPGPDRPGRLLGFLLDAAVRRGRAASSSPRAAAARACRPASSGRPTRWAGAGTSCFSPDGLCLTAVGSGCRGHRAAGPLRHPARPALVPPVRAHRLAGPGLLAAAQRLQRALPGAGQRLVGRVRGGGTAEVLPGQAVAPAGHVLVGVLISRENRPGPLTPC